MFKLLIAFATLNSAFSLPTEQNGRIVGGQDAAENQFPHQVTYRVATDNSLFCGGFIINERWTGTSVRCINFRNLHFSNFIAVFGSNRLSTGGIVYRISRVVDHPDYRGEGFLTYENDISLVQLERNIVYSASVQPIRIASQFVSGGTNAIIAGFGFLTIQERVFSENLQYVAKTTITNNDCISRMPEFLKVEITERILCTFTQVGQGLCLGDTGGAVISNNAVIGVMSFGQACAIGVPDAHVRISHPAIQSWILSVLG